MKLAVVAPNSDPAIGQALALMGIEGIVSLNLGHDVANLAEALQNLESTLDGVEVVLLDLEGCGPGRRQSLIQSWSQRGVCLVVIDSAEIPLATSPGLPDGVDGFVLRGSRAADLACAIWSAHGAYRKRLELSRQLAELELKFRERKLVDQGKAILAEFLGVSELEAMRHLRREARNRRRTMSQMAQTLIDARDIIAPFAPSRQAARLHANKVTAHAETERVERHAIASLFDESRRAS